MPKPAVRGKGKMRQLDVLKSEDRDARKWMAEQKAKGKTVRVKMNPTLGGTPVRGNPNKERVGTGSEALPFDFPAYLLVDRHLLPSARSDMPSVHELAGWTLTVDLYTFGMEIKVKMSRKGVVVVERVEQKPGAIPQELGRWKGNGAPKPPPNTEPRGKYGEPRNERKEAKKQPSAPVVETPPVFDDDEWE